MPWPFTVGLDQATRDIINSQIISRLHSVDSKVSKIMAMLSDIIAKMAQETTDIGSLTVFVQGLQDKINAVPGITPVMQANIDTIFANADKNDAAIVAAMKIGVPVTPPPVVVPPVVDVPPIVVPPVV
jgi:hypothetical protein